MNFDCKPLVIVFVVVVVVDALVLLTRTDYEVADGSVRLERHYLNVGPFQ